MWIKISLMKAGGQIDEMFFLANFFHVHVLYVYNYYTCRWDMSVDEEVYTSTKARSLTGMKSLAAKGYWSHTKHLGCVRQPLFDIALDRIVLDELHLLLRIGDVLLRNLILQVYSMGHRRKEHDG